MTTFSSDADILKYEPALFGELHEPSKVLARGTGATLSGTTLTATGEDFVTAGVAVGGVAYLRSADGILDGAYEILSVDSATQLTVSVVRSEVSDAPVPPPAGSDISYRVSTFEQWAVDEVYRLTEYFGIQPGNPAGTITPEQIVNPDVLRRVSAYGVISNVYAMWSSGADGECCHRKHLLYKQFHESARQRCHLSVDLGGDGVADITHLGGVIRLVRD